MLAFLLLLQQPNLDQLNLLAKNRDVAGLTKYLAQVPKRNPFSVLKTGGAYAAGQRGWTVKEFTTPDKSQYVVFSTPIIAEDMGELLFKMNPAGKLEYLPESDNGGVILDDHHFDIRFDLDAHKLIAADQVNLHWEHGPRSHFFFRISPTYGVRAIYDANQELVPYVQAGGIIAVTPLGPKLNFTVQYDGTNVMPAFNKVFGPQEATLSGSVWYPTVARQPAPYDITMHSPSDWTAIAQGDLVSSQVVGNERITKFHNPIPVVWYSASEGPYKTVETTIDGREYATMSQKLTEEQMAMQNRLNAEVVDFYSKNFTPYPFKRWTALDSEAFSGGPGALEAYSFATYPGGLPGQDSHEPSHTWWGGILPNDYLQSLWNESFAVFSQGLFARNREGANKDELAKAFASVGDANTIYTAAPLTDSGDQIGPAAAALGYGKGASVLAMLEQEIGTETMIKCMSTWAKTNPPRHIGRWEDFEKVVDRVTGKDYTWFFDEWVRRSGYPTLTLSEASWANGQLTGKLIFDGDPYRIHADILMRMADGTDHYSRIDTMQAKDGNGYRFSVACPAKPSLVSVDPWSEILRSRHQDEYSIGVGMRMFQDKVYADSATPNYLVHLRSRRSVFALPEDLSDLIIIGSPEDVPAMKPLCDQAGFAVTGDKLTYQGTTIDLKHGAALALVDLPNGKSCVIGLGACHSFPDPGNARTILVDEMGKPLRARTDPVITGRLAKALP